jgi:hypothetical protein
MVRSLLRFLFTFYTPPPFLPSTPPPSPHLQLFFSFSININTSIIRVSNGVYRSWGEDDIDLPTTDLALGAVSDAVFADTIICIGKGVFSEESKEFVFGTLASF